MDALHALQVGDAWDLNCSLEASDVVLPTARSFELEVASAMSACWEFDLDGNFRNVSFEGISRVASDLKSTVGFLNYAKTESDDSEASTTRVVNSILFQSDPSDWHSSLRSSDSEESLLSQSNLQVLEQSTTDRTISIYERRMQLNAHRPAPVDPELEQQFFSDFESPITPPARTSPAAAQADTAAPLSEKNSCDDDNFPALICLPKHQGQALQMEKHKCDDTCAVSQTMTKSEKMDMARKAKERAAAAAGRSGSENVGLSSENIGENPMPRKPKVSSGRLVRGG